MVLRKEHSGRLKAVPEQSGIYFFYDEKGELLYIGRSTKLKARLTYHLGGHSHLKDNIKAVSFFSIMLVDADELEELEKILILKHKPIWNERLKMIGIYRQFQLPSDIADFIDKIPKKQRSEFVNNVLRDFFVNSGAFSKDNSNLAILENIRRNSLSPETGGMKHGN